MVSLNIELGRETYTLLCELVESQFQHSPKKRSAGSSPGPRDRSHLRPILCSCLSFMLLKAKTVTYDLYVLKF